jgi:acyl-coenzyme A synthetase/AMP-(fatty) acid ligase
LRDTGEPVLQFCQWRARLLEHRVARSPASNKSTPYKRPVRIEFRDALPKSPLGKVLHRELAAQV